MRKNYNLSPIKNYIVHLSAILENNKKAINCVSEEIQKRGYVFLRLTPELVEHIDICLKIIKNFFILNPQHKKKFFKPPIFGYFNVKHKESFRFLTGSRVNKQLLPGDFDELKNLITILDQIMYFFVLSSSPILFPNIMIKAKELDIPFFSMKKQWGMFDITKYYNDGMRTDLNCKEHFDPGKKKIQNLFFSLHSAM